MSQVGRAFPRVKPNERRREIRHTEEARKRKQETSLPNPAMLKARHILGLPCL